MPINGFLLKNAGIYFSERQGLNEFHSLLAIIKRSNISNAIDTYLAVMKTIKSHVDQITALVDWKNLPMDNKQLWCCRELILAITFITCSKVFLKEQEHIKIGSNPVRQIKKMECYAVIMGSSDMCVTIKAPNASLVIAVIEDLWLTTKWFNHSQWSVDLYGDFTMIDKYYMDTHSLDKNILFDMLELTLISYFRHSHSDTFDLRFLKFLVNLASQGSFIDTDRLFKNARARVMENTNREIYYEKLSEVEALENTISKQFNKHIISKKLINLLGALIVKMGEANLHREGNYILVTTIIHNVKIELTKNSFGPLTTLVTRCTLSPYLYILSAIEQLGYLQQIERAAGSLNGGKHFGLLLRAMITDNVLPEAILKENITKMVQIDHTLERLREPDKDGINLYNLLIQLFIS